MARATLLYIVPDDEDARAELAELADGWGEVSGDPESPGKIAEIDLSDCSDPVDDVGEFTAVLKRVGATYFGLTESFEEPTRGARCEARIFYNLKDEEVYMNFPWREGEPDLDRRSMKLAGFAEWEIETLLARFFDPTPSPRF